MNEETAPHAVGDGGDLPDTLPLGSTLEDGQVVEPLPNIDGYEVLGKLGESNSVVWRARQLSTGREVAIKLAGERVHYSEETRRRFQHEAKLAARLKHPNIAGVYDAGFQNGTAYYVMELVRGRPLDQYVLHPQGREAMSMSDIADLTATLCEAMAYAHGQGVVHRDLKPANILVDEAGVPHILDLGCAKDLHTDNHQSMPGTLIGTVYFMTPEQVACDPDKIDGRTDIFALGINLYLLLTGELPFRGRTRQAIMNQITNLEPTPPRVLRPDVPADLEAICLKALEKLPGRRYQHAKEMANDLRRYLAGDPVKAQHLNGLHRCWRWCTHPTQIRTAGYLTVGVAACFIVIHLLGLAMSVVDAVDASTSGVEPSAMARTMLGYILLVDMPCILMGMLVLKESRLASILALLGLLVLFDMPLVVAAFVFLIDPTLYPFKGVHDNPKSIQAVWIMLGGLMTALFALHAAALAAHVVNRDLLAWRMNAADRLVPSETGHQGEDTPKHR